MHIQHTALSATAPADTINWECPVPPVRGARSYRTPTLTTYGHFGGVTLGASGGGTAPDCDINPEQCMPE